MKNQLEENITTASKGINSEVDTKFFIWVDTTCSLHPAYMYTTCATTSVALNLNHLAILYSKLWHFLLIFCFNSTSSGTYLTKTPTMNKVTNIPVALKDIAPIAQADSGRKYTSGIVWQNCFVGSGSVPNSHFIHWVSSRGWRICTQEKEKYERKWKKVILKQFIRSP